MLAFYGVCIYNYRSLFLEAELRNRVMSVRRMDLNEINMIVQQAVSDAEVLEELIKQQEGFILKSASAVSRHYITKNDDEWSVALLAFTQAVYIFNSSKGEFLPFASLVIRRRLTDYFRRQARYYTEISVNPIVFDEPYEEETQKTPLLAEVVQTIAQSSNNELRWEIESINHTFSLYGFTLNDLTECSPKAEKTKKACAQAVACLLHMPVLMDKMRVSKTLPIKKIQERVEIPRKILERHRKYIIAAAEIFDGEYSGLMEYLRFIKEEMNQ